VRAIAGALPAGGRAALHEPEIGPEERDMVRQCVESGWVSYAGPWVEKFERELVRLTGIPHAVAVVNGTAALYLCLKLDGARMGDEVLVPDLTFAAAANAVTHAGCVPHLVDVSEVTLGVDPGKLEEHLRVTVKKTRGGAMNRRTGRRIAAMIVVHAFGHPAEMDGLRAIGREYGITLIEDAAEALGSYYRKRHVGQWGRTAVLSFNGNKIVTTGGGGAILTKDAALAGRLRHFSTTAKKPHPWEFDHDAAGYNFRLPSLNAALGLAQMRKLGRFLRLKRTLAERYERNLGHLPGVRFVKEPPRSRSNYWLNAIVLEGFRADLRDEVLKMTHARGILTRPAWKLMHQLPMYRGCPRADVSSAERIRSGLINLPSSPALAEDGGRP